MDTVLSSDPKDARDQIICREYAKVPDTADEIVSDPALASEFCGKVNTGLPAEWRVDVATCNKRLLNLRRRGEEKGGLIRKHRRFNGRNKPR